MAQSSQISLYGALLFVAAMRHYGWALFEPGLRGMAAKGLGAVAILVLMWALYINRPSKPLLVLFAWWSFEELQVAICSALYVQTPWVVPQGASICSALVGLDIGALGIVAVAFLAIWAIPVKSYR